MIVYAGSPSEALARAAEEAAERLSRSLREGLERAAGVLEELESRGLLHRVEPRGPGGPVYGLDGSLARLPVGDKLLVLLHAAAVPYHGGGEGLHAAAALLLPRRGPDTEAAVEASMIYVETMLLARLVEREPGALILLDGPIVDPPWEPVDEASTREAGEQLAGDPGALLGLHGLRASVAGRARVLGVAKRRTGPGPLARMLSGIEEEAVLAAASRRAGGGWLAVGPWRLGEGVYGVYGGVYTVYLVGAAARLRVEALGDPLGGAAVVAWLTPPGSRLPGPVAAAHRAARVPRGAVLTAARMLAARSLEEAGLDVVPLLGAGAGREA